MSGINSRVDIQRSGFFFAETKIMVRGLMKKGVVFYLLILLFGFAVIPILSSADKTVRDQLDRSMAVSDSPVRIISLAPSITEILFALNLDDRLIGATQFSDYPEKAKLLPKVGSYVNLDIEKIVSLEPDLCLATKDGNPKEIIDVLDALRIPVYAVDPRNLEKVMETVLEIGALLDAEKQADRVVSDMRKRINRVKNRVKTAAKRPKVFYQIGIAPIVSAGTNTLIHELIELAGGENLAKGPVPYPRYSHEQILALAPDIFIITSMARGEVFERVKSEWCQWPEMPAVKHHRILLVDSNLLDRPTPRLVDGLEMLAKIIHPELFEEER